MTFELATAICILVTGYLVCACFTMRVVSRLIKSLIGGASFRETDFLVIGAIGAGWPISIPFLVAAWVARQVSRNL